MNQRHLELLVSEDWRMLLKDYLLPFAFGDRSHGDLGDDVLEIGPGPGLTTDLVRVHLVKLTAIELDPALASALSDRLTGTNVSVVEADATAMPFEPARRRDIRSVRVTTCWANAGMWGTFVVTCPEIDVTLAVSIDQAMPGPDFDEGKVLVRALQLVTDR